jgi:hypothetical protein
MRTTKLLLGVSSVADNATFQSDINAAAEWSVANRLPLMHQNARLYINFSHKRLSLLTESSW